MIEINEKIEKYLIERKPTQADFNIKDTAMELASEIESAIFDILDSWNSEPGGWSDMEMDKSDKMKTLNLALKQIKINKFKGSMY